MASNREAFITSYLTRLAREYNFDKPSAVTDRTILEKQARDKAFEVFSVAVILDKPFKEVYDNILIRGSHDGGMDAVWLEEVDGSYILHAFQCKNSLSLKDNELDKFISNYKAAFESGGAIDKPEASDLRPKIDEANDLTRKGYQISSKLYFVFNGLKEDPERGNNTRLYRDTHKPEEGFSIYDSEDLYDKLTEYRNNPRKTIQFTFYPLKSNFILSDFQAIYSFSINDLRAANFRISATELCKLVDLEKQINVNFDALFQANIRGYLGHRVRPNKKMRETLSDPAEKLYFPFYNNGITLICDKIQFPSAPQSGRYVVPVTNPQIVNGLQTTLTLYAKYTEDNASLEDVFVNVRIYETSDKVLSERITEATNTQNPINFRDKISNQNFIDLAKNVFDNKLVRLITKRGESFKPSNLPYQDTIESDTLIKYWYAIFYEQPEVAKNSLSSVLEEVFTAATTSDHKLSELFRGDMDSPILGQLWVTYIIYAYIQKRKRDDSSELAGFYDEIMSYAVGKYVRIKKFSEISEAALTEAFDDSLIILEKIVSAERMQYEANERTFSYNGYFKRSKSRIDLDNQKGYLDFEVDLDFLLNQRLPF